jgi:hypothetical protein
MALEDKKNHNLDQRQALINNVGLIISRLSTAIELLSIQTDNKVEALKRINKISYLIGVEAVFLTSLRVDTHKQQTFIVNNVLRQSISSLNTIASYYSSSVRLAIGKKYILATTNSIELRQLIVLSILSLLQMHGKRVRIRLEAKQLSGFLILDIVSGDFLPDVLNIIKADFSHLYFGILNDSYQIIPRSKCIRIKIVHPEQMIII